MDNITWITLHNITSEFRNFLVFGTKNIIYYRGERNSQYTKIHQTIRQFSDHHM